MTSHTSTVHVPALLRPLAGGATTIAVPAGTVAEALALLDLQYPALVRAIRAESGSIRPHVNVFVNRDDIRRKSGVQTALHAGDDLIILPSISGG